MSLLASVKNEIALSATKPSADQTKYCDPQNAPGSEDYRGRCKYKTGNCHNERTFKLNGQAHTLCEKHRKLHNRNQRKSDRKRRAMRKSSIDSQYLDGSSPISVSRFQPYPAFSSAMLDHVSSIGAGEVPLPQQVREVTLHHSLNDLNLDRACDWVGQCQWSHDEVEVLQDILGQAVPPPSYQFTPLIGVDNMR